MIGGIRWDTRLNIRPRCRAVSIGMRQRWRGRDGKKNIPGKHPAVSRTYVAQAAPRAPGDEPLRPVSSAD